MGGGSMYLFIYLSIFFIYVYVRGPGGAEWPRSQADEPGPSEPA